MNVPITQTTVTTMLLVQIRMDHLHVHVKMAFMAMVSIVQVDEINFVFHIWSLELVVKLKSLLNCLQM